MSAYAIIPARGGSKGVPRKNLVQLVGHPLIAYSIEAALQVPSIERVIVSTDSEEIAEIALRYGAEVPFLRPSEFASDTSTDREFLIHALDWLATQEQKIPDYLVHLRPTTPLRDPDIIEKALIQLKNTPDATSLRSAHKASKTPYKWFEINTKGYFIGIRPNDDREEYYNLPRQSFPDVYDPNGYVDILRSTHLLSYQSIHGESMLGFVTPYAHEIDDIDDLIYLEYLSKRFGSPISRMIEKRLGFN